MNRLEVVPMEPESRSLRLWCVLLSLAEPPNPPEVVSQHPPVPGRAENLVFEFDEAYTAFMDGTSVLPSETQMLALQAIDTKLAAMVGAKDVELWTERARREDPLWSEVRTLASRVLDEFDWPVDRA